MNPKLFAAALSPLLVAGPISESSAATICTNNATIGRICAGEALSAPPQQVRVDASLALASYMEPTAAMASSWQVAASTPSGSDSRTKGGKSTTNM